MGIVVTARAQQPVELLRFPPVVLEEPHPPVQLTLPEAKAMALEHNPTLALARLNTEEKQHALRAVHSDYLPKVLGSFAYLHYDSPLGSVFTLRNGLSVPVNLVEQDQTLGTVMGAQPITALLKVRGLERITAADGEIACLDVVKARRAVLGGVEQLYVGIWATHRIRQTLSDALTAAKPFENSKDPDLRAAYWETVQGMDEAEGQLDQLQSQLNALLGLPFDSQLILADLPPCGSPVASARHAVELAVTHSPDVCEAVQNLEKAHAALAIVKTDCLPDVNVFGGYLNQNGIGAIQSNIGFVGGTASYTLFDAGKRRHLIRKSETDIAMAQAAIRKAREETAANAHKAFRNYQQTARVAHTAGRMLAVRQAIAQKKAATPAALDAGKDLLNAQVDAIKAEVAHRIACGELLNVMGQQ
ncbi:MAG: TolC family protein [Pirellulales bacterium]